MPRARNVQPAELREVARVRVIYGDTDQMGMVYYGNYLRYFEIARNELLRAAGAPYRLFEEKTGLMLPVVEARVRYRKPARYDDELGIMAGLVPLGRSTARFDYQIRRVSDGERLVEGHTVHACIDGTGRLTRIPDELRATLERALAAAKTTEKTAEKTTENGAAT